MTKINLDGSTEQTYEKVLIPEDTYEATPTEISDPKPFGKFERPGEFQDKNVWTWEVKVNDAKTVMLKKFVPNVVAKGNTRGGKTYKNTAAFDMIEAAGFMPAFKAQADKFADDKVYTEFLRNSFIGKKFKVYVRTVQSNPPYSTVDKIIKKLE